jgi:nucleoside-diphosphate kinase
MLTIPFLDDIIPSMSKERTLVILKPDAVKRNLIGRIIERIESKGLSIVEMKMKVLPEDLVRRHYKEHEGKPFYEPLVKFMTSGRAVPMIVEGESAIHVMRKLAGATNGIEAEPGTIRGDFSLSNRENLIHASDSEESAEREITLFFGEEYVTKKST